MRIAAFIENNEKKYKIAIQEEKKKESPKQKPKSNKNISKNKNYKKGLQFKRMRDK